MLTFGKQWDDADIMIGKQLDMRMKRHDLDPNLGPLFLGRPIVL